MNISKSIFHNLILSSLFILLMTSCSNQGDSNKNSISSEISESQKANDYFEQVFQTELAFSPESQSYLGIKDNADKWDDISDDAARKSLKRNQDYLKWAKANINPANLDEATLLSYQLFITGLEQDIEDFKYRHHDYPVNQMFGVHADAPAFLINIHQISTVKDAENYIARLQGINHYFDQLITNLKTRQQKGILPPKFVFPKVLDDSRNVITGQPFSEGNDSVLLSDLKSKIMTFDKGVQKRLLEQANKALLDSVLPAYTKLIAILEAQQKVATTDDGVWKLPDGINFYNNRLARMTTTDMTADEIHEVGLKEVARIHNEMIKIKEQVSFKGDLQEFFEFMREDKQFYYPSNQAGRDRYIKEATDMIETMKGNLDAIFITQPKADLTVKRVEEFREKSAGKAFYQRPAPDGSRPGIYYANLYDMATMPTYQMEALAYHEGIPGHHMQLSIAQELKDLPKFRKFGGYTPYIEGWGLYSEYLPKEFGAYKNPYSDFGRLAMELWRACRLVVDTGIHAKKWTREQGMAYYHTNTPDAPDDGTRMVERHIVMPGQATAYKIGMLKIMELRQKAKEALGSKFDIREYHEQILNDGAIPLDVMQTKINKWIESKKS